MRTDRAPSSNELSDAMRACRGHLAAAAGFSFGLNLLYLTVPLYSLQVYDRILPSSSESTLVYLTLAAVVALAVLAALDALRAIILGKAGVRLERALAKRVLDVTLERSLALGPSERGQSLRDLETIRQSLAGQPALSLFDLPWIPVYLVALFLIHWALGAFSLLFGLLLLALAIFQDRATRAAQERARHAATANYAFTEAGLRNAEVVRGMGMFADFYQRWERDRLALVRAQLRASERSAAIASAIKLVRLLAQTLMLGAAAYLAIRQLVTPGAIFAAAILLARAIQPVEQVVGAWRSIVAAMDAYRRVNGLLAQQPARIERLELPRPQGNIAVTQASFIAPGGSRPIVQGLSFALAPGEALGVIGPTAAGKSTLARLLVGVYPPSSGDVRIDGERAFVWARGALGRHVGYVPQDVELFPGTVAENIARFGPADSEAVVAAAQLAGIHNLVLGMPLGYATRIGAQGTALSGGQRQLIALARAVYRLPSVVVLDEPNSNLDTAGEEKLLDCLRKLKESGSTVVIISHRLSALHAVDKLLCLQDGRMVGFGPRQDVMAGLARLSAIPSTNRAGDR
jgi:ATP-binding cassette, subfamily C, type I secretion system permease/ATPase